MKDKSSEDLVKLGVKTYDNCLKIVQGQYQSLEQPIYDTEQFESINGLFLRNFRMFKSFLVAPSFWVSDLAQIIFRSMTETNIYMKYLNASSDKDVYRLFKKYGIGQEKQFKSKLSKYIQDDVIETNSELESYVDSNSDNEIWDELVDIDLKNWKNLRELADENGLKLDYDLYFDRYSPVVHGHYNSLREHYFKRCPKSLHRNHLVPDWDGPYMSLESIITGVNLFVKTYMFWIEHWGLDDLLATELDNYFVEMEKILKEEA